MSMGKILVADDDQNIAELLRLYLEKEGRATTTISRMLASIKAFFHYEFREGVIKKDPAELTLYDIYTAIDSDMSIIECLNGRCECTRNGQDGIPCYAHDELKDIQNELWAMLRRKSMEDLFGKDKQ